MKLLLTGATGRLGAPLARRLCALGHHVRVLCRPSASLERLRDLPVEIVPADVVDRESVHAAMRGREAVIHAAADVGYWRRDDAAQMRVNVEGTRHVASAARASAVGRMVYVSSVAAIGIPDDATPVDESFRFNLEGSGLTYHLSKRLAEETVLAEVALGLDAVVVNPASIEHPQRTAALLDKVRRRSWISHFRGGNCVVHPDDVVNGIVAALECGARGERYILGGENVSFRSQAERAARVLGVSRRLVPVPSAATWLGAMVLEPLGRVTGTPPRLAHMIHYGVNRFQYFDSSKARRSLGYRPRDFDQMLHDANGAARQTS